MVKPASYSSGVACTAIGGGIAFVAGYLIVTKKVESFMAQTGVVLVGLSGAVVGGVGLVKIQAESVRYGKELEKEKKRKEQTEREKKEIRKNNTPVPLPSLKDRKKPSTPNSASSPSNSETREDNAPSNLNITDKRDSSGQEISREESQNKKEDCFTNEGDGDGATSGLKQGPRKQRSLSTSISNKDLSSKSKFYVDESLVRSKSLGDIGSINKGDGIKSPNASQTSETPLEGDENKEQLENPGSLAEQTERQLESSQDTSSVEELNLEKDALDENEKPLENATKEPSAKTETTLTKEVNEKEYGDVLNREQFEAAYSKLIEEYKTKRQAEEGGVTLKENCQKLIDNLSQEVVEADEEEINLFTQSKQKELSQWQDKLIDTHVSQNKCFTYQAAFLSLSDDASAA